VSGKRKETPKEEYERTRKWLEASEDPEQTPDDSAGECLNPDCGCGLFHPYAPRDGMATIGGGEVTGDGSGQALPPLDAMGDKKLSVWRCEKCGGQMLPTLASHLHIHDGAYVPAEEVEVIPVDSPNVLTVEEAKAIGELLAGTPSTRIEQLALRTCSRLSKWAAQEQV
jgi:hypothetical protein